VSAQRRLTLAVVSAGTAMLLLTAGVLADRVGRRAIFAAGLLAFTLLSAACGAATSGVALDLGPVVGGLIVDGLGWRWVFLVNLPVGVVLLWLTLTRLPESRDPTPRRLDVPGLLTSAAPRRRRRPIWTWRSTTSDHS
jgi:MFS family permease